MAPIPAIGLQLESNSPSPLNMQGEESPKTPIELHQESLVAMDSQYRRYWDKKMGSFGLSTSLYVKVSVLMIYWHEYCDDLKTKPEVLDLAKVFKEKYNYDVSFAVLEHRGKQMTQIDLNYQLSKFIKEKDDENSLLIVYYAGHGLINEEVQPRQFEMAPAQLPLEDTPTNRVVWNIAENMLEYSSAHVLEIFDACYSGNLGRTRGEFNRKSFEFIAAAQADCTTPSPGARSFTRALIWALEWFHDPSNDFQRFTVNDLVQKIQAAPNFPRDQVPAEFPRNSGRIERMVLAPLSSQPDAVEEHRHLRVSDIESASKRIYLNLSFVCDRVPSEYHIDHFAEKVHHLKFIEGLRITRIGWLGLRSDPTIEAAAAFQRPIRRRRSSAQSPKSPLAPSNPPPPNVEGNGVVLVLPGMTERRTDTELQSVSYHFRMMLKCLMQSAPELLACEVIPGQYFRLCSMSAIFARIVYMISRSGFRQT